MFPRRHSGSLFMYKTYAVPKGAVKMAKQKKAKGTASSMPLGISEGVLMGLFILISITFISAWLLYKGLISNHVLGYLLMAGQLAGAWSGAFFAIKRVQRRNAIVGLSTTGILFALLLGINKILCGGHYKGTLTAGILFSIAVILAVLISARAGRSGHHRKSKHRPLCKIANR